MRFAGPEELRQQAAKLAAEDETNFFITEDVTAQDNIMQNQVQ